MAEPAQITIDQITDFTITQIACWPDRIPAMPAPGGSLATDSGTMLRVEPLKSWLVHTEPVTSMPEHSGAVTLDLSSSRIWLRVGGPKAARLLNHFLPLNLSDRAFPDGHVASTGFHHVGVTLWRAGDAFNLFLPRSFAASLRELLEDTATQYEI